MKLLSPSSRLTVLAFATGLTTSALASAPIVVTNGNDNGDGSLRAALNTVAQQDRAAQVLVVTGDDIKVNSTLVYSGKAPLTIFGNDQTVVTDANTTLLTVSEGADLTVNSLNFKGPGGFNINNRGDADGPAGKGIFVDVRDDQSGVVTLRLENVTVSGVANHGVHISDCNLADDCGGGSGGAGDGSPASIEVYFTDVEISDVGNGKFDADGLRVDERNAGDIQFVSDSSTFAKVGADGVELDEGQAGSVIATVNGDTYIDNGAYCDPDILAAFMPVPDEGEFEEGQTTEADIPGKVEGSPDDGCFEREVSLYDSGSVEEFEFGIDLDDGFDIDEAGSGDIQAMIIGSTVRNNLDEGLDFDEEDAGEINISIWRSTAEGNTDDGIKNSEEGAGGVEALLYRVVSRNNGGKGAVFEQANGGDINVVVEETTTANNDDSDKTGIEVVQDGDGSGTLTSRASDIADGIDVDGVEIIDG